MRLFSPFLFFFRLMTSELRRSDFPLHFRVAGPCSGDFLDFFLARHAVNKRLPPNRRPPPLFSEVEFPRPHWLPGIDAARAGGPPQTQ